MPAASAACPTLPTSPLCNLTLNRCSGSVLFESLPSESEAENGVRQLQRQRGGEGEGGREREALQQELNVMRERIEQERRTFSKVFSIVTFYSKLD
jgi:hypothetical protein